MSPRLAAALVLAVMTGPATASAAPPGAITPPSTAGSQDLAAQALKHTPAPRGGRKPAPPRRNGRTVAPRARAAGVFDRYWYGADASCIGRAVEISVGANTTFGLAPSTRAYWRSWLYVYNPTTGARGWIVYQRWNEHFVTAQERTVGNVVITAHGINPGEGSHQPWVINPGWYVRPAVEVYNWATYGVSVSAANWFEAPNWCYIA
jgi:hypothetical protein